MSVRNAPLPRSTARDLMVLIRMNAAERADAVRGAEKAGMPLSSYLRDRGLAAARRETKRAA